MNVEAAVIPAKAKNPDASGNLDSAKASPLARVKPKMTLSPFHIRITLIRDEPGIFQKKFYKQRTIFYR
ncbi:MAG: hypothetical protein DRH24_07125 [Deltaproteobacteria bacterium]|nr:MAG: hypothetical protein DRH24_07125 [Deltaproteobacteria bacterium]